jgi:hypothetical protein
MPYDPSLVTVCLARVMTGNRAQCSLNLSGAKEDFHLIFLNPPGGDTTTGRD